MNDSRARVVLAVDPGRMKCGIAVARGGAASSRVEILHQSIADTSLLGETVAGLSSQFTLDAIIIGNGTTSAQAASIVRGVQSVRVELVDERATTLLARKRYFRENPPRGFRRLIPTSLQTPCHPYDDYVAVMLAEAYLSA